MHGSALVGLTKCRDGVAIRRKSNIEVAVRLMVRQFKLVQRPAALYLPDPYGDFGIVAGRQKLTVRRKGDTARTVIARFEFPWLFGGLPLPDEYFARIWTRSQGQGRAVGRKRETGHHVTWKLMLKQLRAG